MAEAAKLFDVSRPTLAKHLKEGRISGDHVSVNGAKVWQLDMSELKRVYQRRGKEDAPPLHDGLAGSAPDQGAELQAEIKLLQAKLEAAERLAEERGKHLDDLRRLLPGPQEQPPRRKGWWWR